MSRVFPSWLMGLLACYFLIWPLWRIPFPIEIAPNEAWNAYHADAAAAGLAALYLPTADSLIVNNYPPLSFWTIAAFARLTGVDPLYVGRGLSLLATLVIGALIFPLARRFGAGRAAASFGALWFVAMMARSFSRYVGMNDPQLAGQALMLAAFIWLITDIERGRSPVLPFVAMAICGFWKHNIIAMPATALLWLVLQNRRRAIVPALAGLVTFAAGLAICFVLFGDAFFDNLLIPRPMRVVRALNGLGRLQWVLPALLLWAIWAWSERDTPAARFTGLWIAIALAAYVLQFAGEDILDNAQFDLDIAVAVGIALTFERLPHGPFARRYGARAARVVFVGILVVRLFVTLRNEPFALLTDGAYRHAFSIHSAVARAEAARVAALDGPVACSIKLVCRLAGKPFTYDDFRADIILKLHASAASDELALASEHGITYVVVDPRSEITSLNHLILH